LAVVEISPDEFDELVADALDEIPSELADELDNVVVMVEEWPTAAQLDAVGGAGMLFGLYEGVPATARGPISYSGVAPDRITIFRGPLTRAARDRAELAAQVRVTVLHEVGHWFGMTDARLHELGWA
jgi:predicted Zn-dependent protease with MMP-like domain